MYEPSNSRSIADVERSRALDTEEIARTRPTERRKRALRRQPRSGVSWREELFGAGCQTALRHAGADAKIAHRFDRTALRGLRNAALFEVVVVRVARRRTRHPLAGQSPTDRTRRSRRRCGCRRSPPPARQDCRPGIPACCTTRRSRSCARRDATRTRPPRSTTTALPRSSPRASSIRRRASVSPTPDTRCRAAVRPPRRGRPRPPSRS